MGLAAQEAAAPFPQLCVLIEGLGSPPASAASRAAPGPRAGGRQSGRRANAGRSTGESKGSSVHQGLGTWGSHLCAWEALFT